MSQTTATVAKRTPGGDYRLERAYGANVHRIDDLGFTVRLILRAVAQQPSGNAQRDMDNHKRASSVWPHPKFPRKCQ